MTERREERCAAVAVPPGMAAELAGYQWARSRVGESGGSVHRLFGKAGAPDLFLKHGRDDVAGDLLAELGRLHWLAGQIAVPQVRHFVSTPGEAWLLTTAVPGETAYQRLEAHPEEGIAVVDALAAFLRRLHAIPASLCPFSSDHAHRLALARRRILAGQVDEDDFDEERQGWTAQQVWEEMQAWLPLAPDPVVTHGDFSLDNLLMVGGEVIGCIDVGRTGIADRYQDLAILWNCLGEFGSPLQGRLFERYGIAEPDEGKLQFHLMLDELF